MHLVQPVPVLPALLLVLVLAEPGLGEARNRQAGFESSPLQTPCSRTRVSGCWTSTTSFPPPSTTTRPRSAASPRQGRTPARTPCSGAAYEAHHRFPSISAAAYSAPVPGRAAVAQTADVAVGAGVAADASQTKNSENELVEVLVAVDDGAGTSYAPRIGTFPPRCIFSASSLKCGVRAAVSAVLAGIHMYIADDVPLLGDEWKALRYALGQLLSFTPPGACRFALVEGRVTEAAKPYIRNLQACRASSPPAAPAWCLRRRSHSDSRWGWDDGRRDRRGRLDVRLCLSSDLGKRQLVYTRDMELASHLINIFGGEKKITALTPSPRPIPPPTKNPCIPPSQSPSPHPPSSQIARTHIQCFPAGTFTGRISPNGTSHRRALAANEDEDGGVLRILAEIARLRGVLPLKLVGLLGRHGGGARGRGKAVRRQSEGRRTAAGSALPTRACAEGDVLLHSAVAAGVCWDTLQAWGGCCARTPTLGEGPGAGLEYGRREKMRTGVVLVSTVHSIIRGRGGSGGEGGDKGGDGGTGQGPTIYLGQSQAQEPSEFRTIPRGDVKLVKEVRLSPQSGVVGRQSRGVSVRRAVYHAEIRGDPGTVTVAVYQGNGAEEECRKDVAKYESIWDPHIMQLYGLVRTKGLYAMVFHDELIPYAQFFRRFQHSPISSTYIIGYCPIIKSTQFWEATHFISGVSQKPSAVTHSASDYLNLPGWIQPRTGQLCLDLAQCGAALSSELLWWDAHVLRLENILLDTPDSEDIIISSLSEDQYHELCSQPSIAWHQWFQVSTEHPVGPGIFRSDSQHGTCVRITEPLQILPEEKPHWDDYTEEAPGELLPNLWIRLELNLRFLSYEILKAWLAQANHIFAELQEPEHIEDYVCINRFHFMLQLADERHMPEGYLFVCPPQDFRTGTEARANSYQWPACPAYWSLNPSGADRLSTEDAKSLGFPTIHIETVMHGWSWDCSLYEGLRQFHEGKGFNPYSREVARRLGYPLYEVSSDRTPFPAREVWECDLEDPELCRELCHWL
ncbi:hypothetical protein MSAN_02277400 [Mycena sanguinolenta]|uniref:Uncharacterized protein n=1 Tax=Mycena sanguinolenta TaxID=230812 RepID=A0A8H6XB42_9AGAR|nr:hypothetical protein MSAN_02277400 [Mycena sanguinolenta]